MPDAYAAVEKIKAAAGNVTPEVGPVKGGSTGDRFCDRSERLQVRTDSKSTKKSRCRPTLTQYLGGQPLQILLVGRSDKGGEGLVMLHCGKGLPPAHFGTFD